jgi:hypothetical protein
VRHEVQIIEASQLSQSPWKPSITICTEIQFLDSDREKTWRGIVSSMIPSQNEHNCQIIKVSRHFPSSKLCSKCGFKYEGLKLSERSWVCPNCGTTHNRDLNAAINLKDESIRLARSEFRSVEGHLSETGSFPGFKADPVKQKTGSREIPQAV